MQHTLLPKTERKMLRREYRIRVFILYCFLLSVAGMIGAGALFPSFLFALNEEKTQLGLIEALKKNNGDSGVTALELEFKRDNGLIDIISKDTGIPRASATIESVVSVRDKVKLTSLSVENPEPKKMWIIIQGVAPTRETLLSFKSRLEELVPDGGVELPISDLARSRDIPFSMRVTQIFP